MQSLHFWKVALVSEVLRRLPVGLTLLLLITAAHAAPPVQRGHSDNVYAIAFSPDGSTLASGSDDGTLRLWDPRTGRLLEVLDDERYLGSVDSLSWSPDGRRLAAAVSHGRVLIYDARSRALAATLELPFYRIVVRWSPDGRTLACAARDGVVRLYDGATLQPLAALDNGHGPISGLAWSPDSRRLAVSSWWDDTATVWDVPTRTLLTTLKGHARSVYCVAFSPDGRTLATGSRDGTLRLWDVATGRADVLTSTRGFIHGLDWSRDGRTIATAHEDSVTRLWDPTTKRVRHAIGTPQPLERSEYSQSTAVSPDGTLVAIGRRWGSVRVARVADGQIIVDIPNTPPARVTSLHAADGVLTVTLSDNTTAKWSLESYALMAWDNRGRSIPREYLHANPPPREIPQEIPHPQIVTAVIKSGDRVITGDARGDVRIFDARTKRLEARLYLLTTDDSTTATPIVER